MHLLRIVALATLLVTLVACGSSTGQSAVGSEGGDAPTTRTQAAHDMAGHDTDDHGEGTELAFGQPAEASAADRTIEIRTGNELTFDPEEVTVAPNETVTFSITNDGDLPHDFVIGDEAAQQAHAAEMAEAGDDMTMEGSEHADANAVSVPPGETAQLTWAFNGDTTGLKYGCHEAGHYEAGMVGDIIVEG